MNLDYYISLPQAKTILYRILTNIVQNSNLPIHQKEPFRVDDTTTTSFGELFSLLLIFLKLRVQLRKN